MQGLRITSRRGLVAISLGLALGGLALGPAPAAAQTGGLELSGFGGLYGPTSRNGIQQTFQVVRRGSLTWGGRLTVWTSKTLGFEFTGGFTPGRLNMHTSFGTFPRSTKVALGSAKVALNLTPGTGFLGIGISGGPAVVHSKASVFDPARSATEVGGVGGLTLRINLGENVALRADVEDYFYGGNFTGAKKTFTQDIVASAGLSLKL